MNCLIKYIIEYCVFILMFALCISRIPVEFHEKRWFSFGVAIGLLLYYSVLIICFAIIGIQYT